MSINLLPWRITKQIKQKKIIQNFFIIIFLFSLISGILIKNFLSKKNEKNHEIIIRKETQLNQLLKIQNTYVLTNSIKSEIKIQEKIINILKNLCEIIPKNIYLTQIDIKNKQFQIQGITEKGSSLQDFIENLVKISERQFIIQSNKKNHLNNFHFNIIG